MPPRSIGTVDAVTIASPTEAHHALAAMLLDAGIHVLVEKPMTTTLEQADDLIARAAARGVVLAVGHTERFNPAVDAARAFLSRPRFIEVHRLGTFPDRSLDIDVVFDLMIHDLDVLLSVVDEEVVEVEAVGVPVLTDRVDIANARLKFAGGCIANVTASRISRDRVRKVRFIEPAAYVSVDYASRELEVWRLRKVDGARPAIEGGPVAVPEAEPLRRELEDFVSAVRDGRRAAGGWRAGTSGAGARAAHQRPDDAGIEQDGGRGEDGWTAQTGGRGEGSGNEEGEDRNGMVAVDIEALAVHIAAGAALTSSQLRALAQSRDLIGLGMLAADARTRRHGTRGTFVRVQIVDVSHVPADTGGSAWTCRNSRPAEGGTFSMGELRLVGAPASLDAARAHGDGRGVAGRRARLGVDGRRAVRARTTRRRCRHAARGRAPRRGLGASRSPGGRGPRSAGIGRAARADGHAWHAGRRRRAARRSSRQLRAWQAATGVVRACAPLPVETSPEQPTTGYDDMRHVALARLVLDNVAHIQAHWTRMGAKLSQSCLLFGADDIDGVPARDDMPHGPRRAILEEVRRNLTAASLEAGRARRRLPPARRRVIRIGAVGFLNARPLAYGLDRDPGVSLRLDLPSVCARLLHAGEIDLGLVPVIEMLRGPVTYDIVPGLAIACEGAVNSVALFTRVPVAQVRRLALDVSSRSSVGLVRVLCRHHWGIEPEFVDAAPDLASMLDVADAALMIGDPALDAPWQSLGATKIDLGEAWQAFTGLPFVFAAWVARPGVVTPEVIDLLHAASRAGQAAIPAIAAGRGGGRLRARRPAGRLPPPEHPVRSRTSPHCAGCRAT